MFFTTDKELGQSLKALGALASSPRATLSVIEAFAKIERTLGMNGILDFYNADPWTFEPPPSGTYVSESYNYYAKAVRAIPAFRRSLEQLMRAPTDGTSYVVICVRWPNQPWYANFRNEGSVRLSSTDATVMLRRESYRRGSEYTPEYLAARAVFDFRGSFQYSDFGVFVVAMTESDLTKYFDLNSPWHGIRAAQDISIPAENILALIGAPSGEEQELLDGVLRAYWVRLVQKFNYCAVPTSWEERAGRQARDPYEDPIPEMLILRDHPSVLVGLGSRLDARGVLEGWHRVSQINTVIAEHQRSLLTEGV